ncbi:hypothetical protein HHK36_000586 [Tetracentron sinense]|uniref:C3H1-type domain-containing protein n=1 Tax=Tetracentron sinense TaxID=13715 RepID=A0A834ZUC7_TETSI|nr:hypothetical protein HHK36_000586 [Tetracentron sinense]
MANQLYGHNSSYGGPGISTLYQSRLTPGSAQNPYLSDSSLFGSSRYYSSDPHFSTDSLNYSVDDRGASMFLSQNDGLRYSVSDIGGTGGTAGFSVSRIPGGIGASAAATAAPTSLSQASWSGVDFGAGMKRPTEALYHQTILGTHNTFGQSDAWFSANTLAKRPRIESASNLPIYPQRPGEKDCAHYMLTRNCRFGDSCKFDHPVWVPEGGIPDWKEVTITATVYFY